jgi:hypothetical protein
MTRLVQLIYVSRFVAGNRGVLSEMRSILTVACAKNYREQLTGCLLFDREIFVQILEGEETKVSAAFQHIKCDPRHQGVRILSDQPVAARSFPVWAMAGFVRSDANESLFRRYRFLTQKTTGRFESGRLLALAHALVAAEDASVPVDVRSTEPPPQMKRWPSWPDGHADLRS